MQQVIQDPWAQWLFQGRFSPGKKEQIYKQLLYPIRDSLLKLAMLQEGDVVLDIGCGDGLISFAALEKIGDHGMVIFNDISSTLLDHCRNTARSMQVLERCQFLQASVEDMSTLPDTTAAAITVRSVLIYVQNKQQAFSELYRVLQPGGRLAIFEPIPSFDTFGNPSFPDKFWGYDITPVKEIARKVQAVFAALEPWDTDSTTNFDERDLFAFAEQVGFTTINASISLHFMTNQEAMKWEHFLHLQANPRIPSVHSAMRQALTAREYEEFSLYLRPLVEAGQGLHRQSCMYLQALK